MSEYSKRDLKAVNLLSLILVALGVFILLSTILSHVDNKPSAGKGGVKTESTKVVEKSGGKKGGVISGELSNRYFVVRYILSAVFILCGVVLHFGIKQSKQKQETGDESD